ncbi:MAG: hypothetical protein K2R93_12530 [Gemmatimonadaceae bacterium]|nr:hypothetical protein [Gemmatimonadaceae bacterium]
MLGTIRMRKVLMCCVVLTLVGACQQTKAYTPDLAPIPVRLESLSGAAVSASDFRVEKSNGESMRLRLEEQLRQAIPNARAAGDSTPPSVSVDVIEQRAYFTKGKWHGVTRLRAVVRTKDGRRLGPFDGVGESERFNSVGYTTAKRVGQDSYNAAIADLLSKLRSELR